MKIPEPRTPEQAARAVLEAQSECKHVYDAVPHALNPAFCHLICGKCGAIRKSVYRASDPETN